jgi:hypothetical protein
LRPLLFADAKSINNAQMSNKGIDLKNIDAQIKSLEDLKEHYLAKATRLRNRGDRLQFNSKDDGLISAQKCWQSANQYDKIADQIQGEIDKLTKERNAVLNKSQY